MEPIVPTSQPMPYTTSRAEHSGPTCVAGPIVSPTIWTPAHSPYLVTDTVTIHPDASLTIQPGVEVRFRPRTGLVAEGQLQALGTAARPILFTTDLKTPLANAWDGIRLLGSNNELEHCQIEYGFYGLYIASTSDHNLLSDSLLSMNGNLDGLGGGSILGYGSHNRLMRNQISDSPFGILLIQSSGNIIAGNELFYLRGAGIRLQGTSNVGGTDNVLAENSLSHIGGEGLACRRQSDLMLADNRVYHTAEATNLDRMPTGLPLPLPGGDMPGAGGISIYRCNRVIVTGNQIGENGWGEAPTYRAGVFVSHTFHLVFEGNQLHDNRRNGLEYAAQNGSSPLLQNNAFWGNERFGFLNLCPTAVDVRGNWWGTNSPTPNVEFSGSLTYTPWVTLSLTALPALLPAEDMAQVDLMVRLQDGAGHHAPDGIEVELKANLGRLSTHLVTMTAGTAASHLTTPLGSGLVAVTACAGIAFDTAPIYLSQPWGKNIYLSAFARN